VAPAKERRQREAAVPIHARACATTVPPCGVARLYCIQKFASHGRKAPGPDPIVRLPYGVRATRLFDIAEMSPANQGPLARPPFSGRLNGHYEVEGGLITVSSASGAWRETTQLAGHAQFPEALARLMLSQAVGRTKKKV
jgi:hypothetical protein